MTLTVTDGANLSASCVMEAYSVDVTPPVTTCPDDQVLNTDPNTCTAVAMFMPGGPTTGSGTPGNPRPPERLFFPAWCKCGWFPVYRRFGQLFFLHLYDHGS
ncbi:MAG: hypothetical protein IPJ82_17015 [Lewinellaceae bacterium]|nr:hypothetical protein [Lewinellaceae bacterium]